MLEKYVLSLAWGVFVTPQYCARFSLVFFYPFSVKKSGVVSYECVPVLVGFIFSLFEVLLFSKSDLTAVWRYGTVEVAFAMRGEASWCTCCTCGGGSDDGEWWKRYYTWFCFFFSLS